ncbi:MAG: nickel pincer cofactor biosynthesis protein LarC [Desulfatiglans sp.]|jgi:uncharacterized protein (TIGR00299 family) protein|nr:nickel pincer cofactor biosynthesis protein LarC [Thermodesulfobacteriota bacterium]MEE4352609.1 nickel pincer cofactor biosynthesis protein LarC [Desulfatiglans sp.]
MKKAYLDCFSGISGDMFLGALLDAGLVFNELEEQLRALPFEGYKLELRHEMRQGIRGSRFIVNLDKKEQPPRGLKAIEDIILEADLSESVKERSIRIFQSLADAEGKIHNRPPSEIHFHEIGAVDSIIDIVGTVYGLEQLEIASLSVSSLPLGSGFTDSSHGRIPLPAPATVALLAGVPVYDSGARHEMVTPTGAALTKGLAASFGPMPPMTIETVGYGAGKRDLPDRPNLVRILIGKDGVEKEVDTVVVLTTNIDDMNPEWIGHLMEALFEAGALDVICCPVQMKKNRPGVQIQVLGRPDQKDALMDILFRETTSLGIRFEYSRREILERAVVEVESPWGRMKLKKVVSTDGSFHFFPEYDACREIARGKDLPLREIYSWVVGFNNDRSRGE